MGLLSGETARWLGSCELSAAAGTYLRVVTWVNIVRTMPLRAGRDRLDETMTSGIMEKVIFPMKRQCGTMTD